MRIISKKRLREFWEKHPDAKEPLLFWHRLTRKARWRNLTDTRKDFPHADLYLCCTIFNIKGNDYRLVAKIFYGHQKVFIRHVLTHRDYDRGSWKNDCENQ